MLQAEQWNNGKGCVSHRVFQTYMLYIYIYIYATARFYYKAPALPYLPSALCSPQMTEFVGATPTFTKAFHMNVRIKTH